MNESKRILLAVVLSVCILLGYTYFIVPSPLNHQEYLLDNSQENLTNKHFKEEPIPEIIQENSRLIQVETPLYIAYFDKDKGTLKKILLKQYFEQVDKKEIYTLLDLKGKGSCFLEINAPQVSTITNDFIFKTKDTENIIVNSINKEKTLTFSKNIGKDFVLTKQYKFTNNSYAFTLCINIKNITKDKTLEIQPQLNLIEDSHKNQKNSYAFTGVSLEKNGSLTEFPFNKLKKNPKEYGSISWMSMNIPYFMGAILPLKQNECHSENHFFEAKISTSGIMEATIKEDKEYLSPGENKEFNYFIFYGPRDLKILKTFEKRLTKVIDFGWFDFIAKPMLSILNFLYSVSGNYGVSIILITIFVKIIFWPLASKSYTSMKKMQKIQPQIARIREKYKSNKQTMNQEIMRMYKTYNVNPMGGCLPMLVQIPVFIAFYKVLGSSIELRHAPFMLWINDLSSPDRLFSNLNIPYVGGIPVLTLLMGMSMFIQQKMTPAIGDSTQTKIMLLMPVIFTFIFVNFPSGLVLYWLVNNLLSIGQQYYINKLKA